MSPIFREKIGSLLGALINTNDVITNAIDDLIISLHEWKIVKFCELWEAI